MELLQSLYLTQTMHAVSDSMTVPVVVILMVLVVYSLYTIGSVLVEAFVERRAYAPKIPSLVARLGNAEVGELGEAIGEAGLLGNQTRDLQEMVGYLHLTEDARTEVAKRLLANERLGYQKALDRTDMAAKVAPMLGLMGTLIPLGPGLVALGAGDTQTLSNSLQFAFDTTVAGLATAVVCFIVTRIRRRWYSDYLVNMEAVYNTLLEKGRLMQGDARDAVQESQSGEGRP